MPTSCPQCGQKVPNVARHIAQRRDHQKNYEATISSRQHDYADLSLGRTDVDFDDTWFHQPVEDDVVESGLIEENQRSQVSDSQSDMMWNDKEFPYAGHFTSKRDIDQ